MFEQLILKQIAIFNLEAKYNKLENGLEKISIALAIKKLKKEVKEI